MSENSERSETWFRFRFTFLIYPSDIHADKHVAHCLQLDLVAVEDTADAALELLKELVEDHIDAALADGTLGRIFKPAPPRYWQMLADATDYQPSTKVIQRRIDAERVRSVDYALAELAPA